MTGSRNEEMSLKELVLQLWSGRWIVLATTVLAATIGILYALSARPVYKVSATVQIESKDGAKAGSNPLGDFANMFEMNNPAETEIEIIKSRMVLGRVIEDRQYDLVVEPMDHGFWQRLRRVAKPSLEVDRFAVPMRKLGKPFVLTLGAGKSWTLTSEIFPGTATGEMGKALDSAANPFKVSLFVRGAEDAPAGTRFSVLRLNPLSAYESMLGHLSVSEKGKKTGIVALSYTGYDPDEAAEILNDIANAYLRQNVERKSAEAEKTLAFLQEQLPEIKTRLEASEQLLNQFRSQMGSVDLSEEAKLALGQQVDVQQKLFEAQQKRKAMQQLFKEDHPNIKTLDSSIASLSGKLGLQEQQVKALPMQQQEVVRLMRDVQVNTEIYTGLLNNSQQLKVVKAGEIGNVRIVDSALPTSLPIEPKKKVVVLLSLVLGFFAGAGLVLLRRMFQGGVEDPRTIEKELGLPVYASIPHSDMQEKLQRQVKRREKGTHLLALKAPEDLAVESFRSLRTTLHFSMLDAPNKILLLVGPSPSIGKSFVSSNFAATLAMAGSRVLLLDADLRRGHIHQFFGTPRGEGLSDILSGAKTIAQVVTKTEVPGLSFLSTGTIPPNPSELLLHENFARTLEELKPLYDYIVIDSAPVLAVTDGVILGKLAGTTLMVLKHGQHPMAEIEACQARLAQADVALKGVVFNDITVGGSNAYRYGSAAYQYSYTPKKS